MAKWPLQFEENTMKKSFIAMRCALVLAWSGTVHASALGKVFKRVSGSVVVILIEEKFCHQTHTKEKK